MTMQLGQLAKFVDGRLVGDPALVCHGANPPGDASPGEITMLDDPSRCSALSHSPAIAVITGKELELESMAQIVVESPHHSFFEDRRPFPTADWSGLHRERNRSDGVDLRDGVGPCRCCHWSGRQDWFTNENHARRRRFPADGRSAMTV